MRCRQTIVGWLSSFILLGSSLGICFAIQSPALAARQFSQTADVIEVSPPETIQRLRAKIDRYQPQVKILSPAADQIVKDDAVTVRFEVKDLPIFKDAKLGLGPHLNVLLDNQPAQEVYDLSQPLVFKDLEPGTHTIRAFATRPWSESFKNPDAFAQTTFHIFTKTTDNHPLPNQPLLTYGQPQGVFGTDTVLIDFYLSNLPADATNWRALVSVNGSEFKIDDWQPFYVKGLKPGKNWVQMQLTDRRGRKIENAFNETIRIVDLKENGSDTLSKLVRGDLSALDAGGIVDPNYKRPQPPVQPVQPKPAPVSPQEPAPSSKIETPKSEIVPAPVLKQPAPVTTPKPAAPAPKSTPKPSVEPPAKPAETKSETQKQPGPSIQPTAPSQKAKQSPAESSTRTPIQKESPTTAKKTDTNKVAPFPTKPTVPTTKTEQKTKTPPQPEKSFPSSDSKQPQPKTSEKTQVKEKTAPKSLEKPAPSKLGTSTTSTPKTAIPKQNDSKASTGSSTPSGEVIAPAKEQSPAIPSQSKQPKPQKQDQDSTLKTTFTKFWQQVRPAQKSPKPLPTPSGEKAPAKTVEPTPTLSPTSTKKIESKSTAAPPNATKKVEPKPTPNRSSSSTQQLGTKKPTASSPTKSQVGAKTSPATTKTPTVSSPQIPTKSQTAIQAKPPSSKSPIQPQPATIGPKKAESGSKSTSNSPQKIQPKPSTPFQKGEDPNSSVFSAFRDRLQQLQKDIAPAEQKPNPSATSPKATTTPSSVKPSPTQQKPSTPTKTEIPKPSNSEKSTTNPKINSQDSKQTPKPSEGKSQSSALSAFRDRWQQQKQLISPPAKTQPSSVKPAPQKTPEATGAITKPSSQNQVKPKSPSPSSTPTVPKKPAVQSPTSKSVQQPKVSSPAIKEPAVTKPVEPKPSTTDSVFSSLRGKWQQQKQLMTPMEKPQPTPVKPTPKTPTSAATPLPSQNKVAPARPSSMSVQPKKPAASTAPKSMQKPSTTKPIVKEPVKAKSVETQPAATQPVKPKPTESVFSSLRDRWQQQTKPKQPTTQSKPTPVQSSSAAHKTPVQAKSPTPMSPIPTAKKSEPMKPVAKPSTLKRSVNSDLSSPLPKGRQQLQMPNQQKKVVSSPVRSQQASSPKTPNLKGTPSPTVAPSKPKVASPPPSTNQSVQKADDAPSGVQVQPESAVFDPGVFYRRFFSGKTPNAASESAKVSPTP